MNYYCSFLFDTFTSQPFVKVFSMTIDARMNSFVFLNIKYFVLNPLIVIICMYLGSEVLTHAGAHAWRPKVDIGYLQSLSYLILHTVSPTEPGTSVLARLHGQDSPRIVLFPQSYTEVVCL